MAANTKGTTSWRAKWMQKNLAETLKNALVAEKICSVDNSDNFYIWNPYGSAPTTTIQALAGTYTVDAYTSTNDTLTVTDEFIVAEHMFDFEKVMQHGDVTESRLSEMIASVATAIDKYVLNFILTDGTGAYTTPAGGFTTFGNIPKIVGDLLGKVAGYADAHKGTYLVIESTDVTGFIQSGATNGFSFADSWLNNGFMGSYMGVDLYVVRSGTFVTATLGTKAVVGAGHRLFGVKGVTTYASPRGVTYDEKSVTLKTGKELVVYGYCGVAVWVPKAGLSVDVTLA